jgi:hypothetical protein
MAEQMEGAEKGAQKIAEQYPHTEQKVGEQQWTHHQAKDGDTLGEN